MPTALHVPGLTDTQKLVLLALTEHANAEHADSTFVGQGRIAVELGKARETVNRAMRSLEAAGYIVRKANYRATAEGKRYRSSDTTVVVYAAMQAAIDAEAVEKGADDPEALGDPSDERSLPLVTRDHDPSDERSLGVVTRDHDPSDTASQQNRELNRESNREANQEREIGNSSAALNASVERAGGQAVRNQAMDTLDPDIKQQAVDLIQGIAGLSRASKKRELTIQEHHRLDYLEGDFINLLTVHVSDDAAGMYENETWKIPDDASTPSGAGRRLGIFLNTMRAQGFFPAAVTTT